MNRWQILGGCRILPVPPVTLEGRIYAGAWQLEGRYLRKWWRRNKLVDTRRKAAR
jgi:hypothetical protein